jgi:hypothetical protein
MDSAPEGTAASVAIPRFGKKGKTYRRRVDPDDAEADEAARLKPVLPSGVAGASSVDAKDPSAPDPDAEDVDISVTEVLRLRQARRAKFGGGVGFRAGQGARDRVETTESDETALVRRDEASEAARQAEVLMGMTKRFAPQTGLAGELVNKHM